MLPCALPSLRPFPSSRALCSWSSTWSEGAHGISHVSYSPTLPGASNTALPITTSCSFNRTLWSATGNQIGREGRAFQNAGQAGSTYWAPCVAPQARARARRPPPRRTPLNAPASPHF